MYTMAGDDDVAAAGETAAVLAGGEVVSKVWECWFPCLTWTFKLSMSCLAVGYG